MFTPTFLINLARDHARLAYMDQQLSERDISYARIEAVYGRDVDTNVYVDREAMYRVEKRELTSGDIGTALSHRSVYEQVLREDMPYALILEDDVALPINFKEIVEQEVEKNTQKGVNGWEYLAFDYGPIGFEMFSIWFRSFVPRIRRAETWFTSVAIIVYGVAKFFYILPMFLFEIFRNLLRRNWPGPVKFYRPMYNAGAYIVTNVAAQKLLDLATPVYCTSDRLHNQARIIKGLRVRWYAPAIVRQVREEFGSTASEQEAAAYKNKTAYVK